jgi:glycosyltransferase involved in cell wall biosynthesis
MDKKVPTASVIIPSYNRAHIVGQAILSVLNQTYQDFEIIIVDDGSTDNTESVVNNFNDFRIRYIRHEVNRGASAARNSGIWAARSECIGFLDSDDEWLTEKLAKQIFKLQSSEDKVALVYTGEILVENGVENPLKRKKRSISGNVFERLLQSDFIGTCSSVMVRASAIKKIGGFDEQLISREDWDLWLRISQNYKIACIPERLIIRHIGGHSRISTSLRRTIEGTKAIINKHRKDMGGNPKLLGKHIGAIAIIELNYNLIQGWKTVLEAMKIYFFQPKLGIALFISLFGCKVYRKIFFGWKKYRGDHYIGKSSL